MTDDTLAPEDNSDTVEIDDTSPVEPAPEDKPKGRAKRAPSSGPADDGAPATFTVEAKMLKAALAGIDAVVEGRNTIPILSHLMIRAQHGQATLVGTDLDVQCVHHLDVEQAADGPAFATTVGARTLKDIAAKVAAEAGITLTLEAGATKVIVTAGRARFTLPTLPSDDFPMMHPDQAAHQFEIAAFDLAAMIAAVRFAMSSEETRYYLNGIYLHAASVTGPTGDGEGTLLTLRGVATDGHRLAHFDVAQPDGAGALGDAQGGGVIVPRKAIGLLDKMLDGYEGAVGVAIGVRCAVFDFGKVELTSKLIDGQFPDYTRVIPTGNEHIATVDPKALAAAADRVQVMAAGKERAVRMDFTGGQVTLRCVSPELGEANEECPVDYDGPELTVGFNGKYLGEALARLQGAEAELVMADGTAPVLLRDTNPDARGLFVLMPMRV